MSLAARRGWRRRARGPAPSVGCLHFVEVPTQDVSAIQPARGEIVIGQLDARRYPLIEPE